MTSDSLTSIPSTRTTNPTKFAPNFFMADQLEHHSFESHMSNVTSLDSQAFAQPYFSNLNQLSESSSGDIYQTPLSLGSPLQFDPLLDLPDHSEEVINQNHPTRYQNKEDVSSKLKHPGRRNMLFEHYPRADAPLQREIRTTEIFSNFPNHIELEDIEELWRLGWSARQISNLMPGDTHCNKQGVRIVQHHSWIQKKFSKFKVHPAIPDDGLCNRAQSQDGQASSSSFRGNKTPAGLQETQNSSTQALVYKSASGEFKVAEMRFHWYPFDPSCDQAFEARMSTKLNKLVYVDSRQSRCELETSYLEILIQKEAEKHRKALSGQQALYIRQKLMILAGIEQQNLPIENLLRLFYMLEIKSSLQANPHVYHAAVGSVDIYPYAVQQLRVIIEQLYSNSPPKAHSTLKCRLIFNFRDSNAMRWRIFARMVYYLRMFTSRIEDAQKEAQSFAAATTPMAYPGLIQNPVQSQGGSIAPFGRFSLPNAHQTPVMSSKQTQLSMPRLAGASPSPNTLCSRSHCPPSTNHGSSVSPLTPHISSGSLAVAPASGSNQLFAHSHRNEARLEGHTLVPYSITTRPSTTNHTPMIRDLYTGYGDCFEHAQQGCEVHGVRPMIRSALENKMLNSQAISNRLQGNSIIRFAEQARLGTSDNSLRLGESASQVSFEGWPGAHRCLTQPTEYGQRNKHMKPEQGGRAEFDRRATAIQIARAIQEGQ